ncbi:MAG: Kelch repeat-containing protein, partial [Polyangiales bacterium]
DVSLADGAGDGSTDDSSTSDGTVSETGKTDSGTCTTGATENRKCGYCGNQSRTCIGGTWEAWSSCSGEDTSLECAIGDVRASDCGMCGVQKDTCDPTSCTWNLGSCTGAGECEPAATETTAASCPTVGEVRTRTCSDKCKWSAYGDCTLPKGWLKMVATTLMDGRIYHTAVWTGTEVLIWGGYGTYMSPSYARKNGAAYNVGADSWRALSTALPTALSTGRYQHTSVWTGSKMIVWGGYDYSSYRADGGIYDPSTDSWASMATSPLLARRDHGAVWSTTTNEMIVWGGYGSCSGTYCSDGASYDPALDKWTALPTAPIAARYKPTVVWTGSEVVIWGGSGSSGYLRDGARYDPKTKIWTKFPDPPTDLDGRYDHVSVWSGKEVLIWGGYGNYVSPTYGKSNGARYLPGGSWTMFSAPPTDIFSAGTVNTRFAVQAWFGDGKMFLWSGANGNSSSGTALAGAASYDPATDAWATVDTTDAPTIRARATVAWTGKEAVIWGGSNYASGSTYYTDGVVYRP